MLPPHDLFPFYCFQFSGLSYLARGSGDAALSALADSHFTPVCVRYAFLYGGTLQPFFPTMAADDRGALYRGLDAFDWMRESGLLFPRSDAMGMWSDGREDQIFLKQLDLAVSPVLFASPSADQFPGMRVAAAVVIARAGGFPTRIVSSVPTFQLRQDHINLQGLQLLRDLR